MAKSTATGRTAKGSTASVKTVKGQTKAARGRPAATHKAPSATPPDLDTTFSAGIHVGGAMSEPEGQAPEPEIRLLAEAAEARDAVEQHEHQAQTGRECKLDPAKMFFDAAWYRENYHDVRLSGVDPVQHYMTFGYLEGRNPNGAFSTLGYMAANPDIANAGINAFLHYILHGAAEGRSTEP